MRQESRYAGKEGRVALAGMGWMSLSSLKKEKGAVLLSMYARYANLEVASTSCDK